MSNWTLTQAREKVKFFLRPINEKLYQYYEGSEQPIIDLLNEGIADMCSLKAPYTLWSPTTALAATLLVMLDGTLLSIKRVQILASLADTEPVVLQRPEDYDIHDLYLEFTEEQTGILQILATKRPALLAPAVAAIPAVPADPEAIPPTEEVPEVPAVPEGSMPFGSPFQLGVVYYAVAALAMTVPTNTGMALSGQYMNFYERIKSLWEHQTFNEHTTLRGQDVNPINAERVNAVDPFGKIDVW